MTARYQARVRIRQSADGQRYYFCPACRISVAAPPSLGLDAGSWWLAVRADQHARRCIELRSLNGANRCWNCEGAGRVASKHGRRWIADTCLVCLGAGWTTEHDPTDTRRPR